MVVVNEKLIFVCHYAPRLWLSEMWRFRIAYFNHLFFNTKNGQSKHTIRSLSQKHFSFVQHCSWNNIKLK